MIRVRSGGVASYGKGMPEEAPWGGGKAKGKFAKGGGFDGGGDMYGGGKGGYGASKGYGGGGAKGKGDWGGGGGGGGGYTAPAGGGGGGGGYGIAGLSEALTAALEPVAHIDTQWGLEEMVQRVSKYITKGATKYAKDERASQRGTAIQAQALIDEFVDSLMGAISAACYDKAWFPEANFVGPLTVTAVSTFRGCKLFARTLAPMLEKWVEEGIFRFREEERIQKAMWEAISLTSLSESYHKKCSQHLQKSYDEAHIAAPYGSTEGDSAEMRMLQDFVKGWITEFMRRAWDVLENGVPGGADGEKILFVTTLFSQLCGPEILALPHDLVAPLGEGGGPPADWPFIGESVVALFDEANAAQEEQGGGKAKRRKGGGGKMY
eukprot:gnl/TRDRNA2_/TRDRNA2_37745_c0_seq3.p1 gnl/TRDRNA2_/TRDRNA2_37745_c0~~gnl/TRDRNA2_/TRDRNA2_37745_c0_seq3.p1  ORF type:complete len:379 (-),score=77.95 gnl/TRDRNA2_/TRDRNA2_37745_c0_seq3:72-1208(-)